MTTYTEAARQVMQTMKKLNLPTDRRGLLIDKVARAHGLDTTTLAQTLSAGRVKKAARQKRSHATALVERYQRMNRYALRRTGGVVPPSPYEPAHERE